MCVKMEINRDAFLHFKVIRFISECAIKLHMTSVPLATACTIYHKFFKQYNLEDYDPYLMATTAIYLAGKVEEEHLKLRDVINVSHRTLHPNSDPLDIGEKYWSFRDAVANTELFLMRALKFQVSFYHPHTFMLHYLTTLSNWIDTSVEKLTPSLSQTAWSLLRDSYHGDICLKYRAEHIAVSVIFLAMECHGIPVPYDRESQTKWWQALSDDITIDIIKSIVSDIIDIYQYETTVR